MKKLVSISTAAETLRDWDRNGTLVPVKTPGNHRRYKIEDSRGASRRTVAREFPTESWEITVWA